MTEPLIDIDTLVECYSKDPKMTPHKWVQWACDCAERALPLYETSCPNDTRPRDALAASRRWLDNPTPENARAAARAAAYAAYAADATPDADTADAAADVAARAADATPDAAAAYAAARAAAYAAAYAADAAAERQWQAFRLMGIYHA